MAQMDNINKKKKKKKNKNNDINGDLIKALSLLRPALDALTTKQKKMLLSSPHCEMGGIVEFVEHLKTTERKESIAENNNGDGDVVNL